MTASEVMKELKRMGTAQNVKVYKRHGCGDNVFGVSFANLNALKKRIKVDPELAEDLWETGNVDARSLAAMIADPNSIKATTAEKWVKSISYYLLSDLLSSVVAQAPFGFAKMKKWMSAKKEFIRACGYNVLACALRDGAELPAADGRRYLKTIEKEIHGSPNRARHSMNAAVIAIGVYCPDLREEAIATAKRIGEVDVDHGETSCKTPDAIEYIKKTLVRKKPMKKKAAKPARKRKSA